MQTKYALITGGTHGLGLAMAEKFGSAGFKVILCARKLPDELNGRFDFLSADLSVPGEAVRLAAAVREQYGRLDVLINNVGIGVYAKWDELETAELRKLFEVDFFASAELSGELLPLLKESRGCMINISSMAGKLPVCCMGPYSAVKAALFMFSETLRMENAGEINVITVCPGRIDTGFSKRAIGGRKVPETPGNKSATPEKLAEKVYRTYRRGGRSVVYPAWYGAAVWFARLFPGLYSRISRRVWELDK